QEPRRELALHDLTGLAVGDRPIVIVHDPDLEALDGRADGSDAPGEIGGREARALGEPVTLVDAHAEAPLEAGPQLRGPPRAPRPARGSSRRRAAPAAS